IGGLPCSLPSPLVCSCAPLSRPAVEPGTAASAWQGPWGLQSGAIERAAMSNENQTPSPHLSDDVIAGAPPSRITIGADGTADAALAAAEPLPDQSIKEGFTGAATTMGDNLEGGSPGLPKDPAAFSRAFYVLTQVLSLFTGFHTFMTAVRRPTEAALVP